MKKINKEVMNKNKEENEDKIEAKLVSDYLDRVETSHYKVGKDTNTLMHRADKALADAEDAANTRHRESEDAMVLRHRQSEDSLREEHRATEDKARGRHREARNDSNITETRLSNLAVKVGALCSLAIIISSIIITLLWTWHVGRPAEVALGLVPADTVSGKQMAAKVTLLEESIKELQWKLNVAQRELKAEVNLRRADKKHEKNKLRFMFGCFFDSKVDMATVDLTELPDDWHHFYQPVIDRLHETNATNVLGYVGIHNPQFQRASNPKPKPEGNIPQTDQAGE